jgi:glycosyltransferase involved in cell wall biosynthesis
MNKNILWLASWYPNILSPYDGDFIQRHARAAALFQKLTVIYIKKDEKGIVTKNLKIFSSSENNLTEITVLYYVAASRFKFLNKIISVIKYKRIYKKLLKKYVSENGKPDLVHVHVALKAGVQALWLKKKFKIPFIVSEHWSGYLSEAKNGVKNLSVFQKSALHTILNKAEKIIVVSDVLGKAIKKQFEISGYTIVQNAVDTNLFFPEEKSKNDTIQFIHISSLNYEKNIPAIIEAFHLVRKNKCDFSVLIFGPADSKLDGLIKKYNLRDVIECKNEVPQAQLASYLRAADALILYSRYETFGCVVIEANACGVPAILSDLSVFREYVTENESGIFVKQNSPDELAAKIEKFIRGKYHFNKKIIAEKASQKFSYNVIGMQLVTIYENLLTT